MIENTRANYQLVFALRILSHLRVSVKPPPCTFKREKEMIFPNLYLTPYQKIRHKTIAYLRNVPRSQKKRPSSYSKRPK